MAELEVACEVEISSSSSLPPPPLIADSPTSSTSSSRQSFISVAAINQTTATATTPATCVESSESKSDHSVLMENEDSGDDVVCIGSYRPSTAILPCFLPCCKNTFVNRVIPVRLMHAPASVTLIRPTFSGIIMPQKEAGKKPLLFPEPPESEWTTVTVFHWDPRSEVLRYRCRSCTGLIERWSFQSRSQFFTDPIPNQCVNCSRSLSRSSQSNQFLHDRFTEQTIKVIHCIPRAKLHSITTPYSTSKRPHRHVNR